MVVSNTVIVLIGCLIFLIIIGMFLFFFLFKRAIKLRFYRWRYKHNFIRCVIIYGNNQAKELLSQIEKDLRIKDGKDSYIIVAKEVINYEGLPTLFFMHGNPNPLSFSEVKDLKVRLNTENFELSMTQKIIKDILSESINLKILMILVGMNLLLTVVIILKQWGVFDKK